MASQIASLESSNEDAPHITFIDDRLKSNTTTSIPLPSTITSSYIMIDKETASSLKYSSKSMNVDEIDLSSIDDHDQTPAEIAIATYMSPIDKPTIDSSFTDDQDESTNIYDEKLENNDSSNIPPATNEISNFNDPDLYDNVSSTCASNQSTTDSRLLTNEHVISKYIVLVCFRQE
jgi:hypothetical protein